MAGLLLYSMRTQTQISMPDLKTQNYFAIDLELNNKKDGSIPKIIEVGVAIGKPTAPDEINTINWYLDPEESIDPFIVGLTGITDEIIKDQAVSHETVATQLGSLLQVWNCYPNPITWGGSGHSSDAEELKAEFEERGIDFPFFGRHIMDVKTIHVFDNLTKGKSPKGGLARSMKSCGLDFKGTPHRAIDDAENTLRFFFHYLNKYNKIQESVNILRGF